MAQVTPYAEHLSVLLARATTALERGGFDHLLIASGVQKTQFLDDRPYSFRPNPHFLHFLPLAHHTDGWIVITPGKKPVLIYFQPADYWHLPPAAPSGEWVEHFDIHIITEPQQAAVLLPRHGNPAILGEADAALPGFTPNNPQAVLDHLHWHRAFKTPYELNLMREASLHGARGHLAAERAFRAGASELDIHRAYLRGAGHTERELPYDNIVALNEHAAVLHYQYQNARAPDVSRSFLIDAGASVAGYASDITRTYGNGDELFAALVESVDVVQRQLVDQVRSGRDYRDIHLAAHLGLAGVLEQLGLVRMSAASQVETGVSSVFFPHGIGHLLGLQVHDVAGLAASETGGTIPRPQGHPYLRLTRTLGEGCLVTIEPGLYFIPMLLQTLRSGPHAHAVNWVNVEHLRAFGGVRIEDDVLCTAGAPENLTRDAFAALA